MLTPMLPLLAFSLAPPPPTVSQVVVYPDRAQVTRAVDVPCGPRAVAHFTAIPPSVDPGTFRAHASVGSVEGLRSEEHTRDEAFSAERADLDKKLRALELEERALREDQARADGQSQLASRYLDVAVGLVSREMSEAAPNTRGWAEALQTAYDTRLKSTTRLVDDSVKLRALHEQIEDLRLKRDRLQVASARREYEAEVLVSCPSGSAGKDTRVELTYMVGGASWEPAYEARADEAGGAVEITTYATVHQATGEDWLKAKVILSTAVPRQDATPPELAPLMVWAEERKPPKKVLVRRDEYQEHAETQSSTGERETGGVVRAAGQGLSVELIVPDASDVPGDGSPARLLVARTRMKARFAYRAVPKLMPFVFRVADLANTAPFPLLAGTLDAYRNGAMLARYPLARVAEGAVFHLTFGVEESLRARRVTVEEIQRDRGLFGTTRRFHYSYRYELANWLGRPEEIEISDHIAVSELDDVKVAIDDKTSGGYELRRDDGIVIWRVKLAPGEKRDLNLAFHVDVPSSYDTGAM